MRKIFALSPLAVTVFSTVAFYGGQALSNYKADRTWYIGAKLLQSFASFQIDNKIDGVSYGKDKYSFQPMTGGSIQVGARAAKNWRVEGELGWTGLFSDKGKVDVSQAQDGSDLSQIEYVLSVPYLAANAIYDAATDRKGGFYIGGGLGVAIPMTKLSGDAFLSAGELKTAVSPVVQVVFGWSWALNQDWALDLGYKFQTFSGTDQSRKYMLFGGATQEAELESGWVMNNAVSFGARYKF